MERIEAAKNVAEKLFATEASVDAAMVKASQLLEAMVVARTEMNLSAVAGEVATTRCAESIAALSEARRAVVAAHHALANLAKKMDLPEFGPMDKPAQDRPAVTPAAELRVAS